MILKMINFIHRSIYPGEQSQLGATGWELFSPRRCDQIWEKREACTIVSTSYAKPPSWNVYSRPAYPNTPPAQTQGDNILFVAGLRSFCSISPSLLSNERLLSCGKARVREFQQESRLYAGTPWNQPVTESASLIDPKEPNWYQALNLILIKLSIIYSCSSKFSILNYFDHFYNNPFYFWYNFAI